MSCKHINLNMINHRLSTTHQRVAYGINSIWRVRTRGMCMTCRVARLRGKYRSRECSGRPRILFQWGPFSGRSSFGLS
ncbi:hypothetical protein Hanom_Chr09g00811931 [Helianthus anomalus]